MGTKHACRAMRSAVLLRVPCLSDADWCLQFDVTPDPRPCRPVPGCAADRGQPRRLRRRGQGAHVGRKRHLRHAHRDRRVGRDGIAGRAGACRGLAGHTEDHSVGGVHLACGLEFDHFARLVPSSMLPCGMCVVCVWWGVWWWWGGGVCVVTGAVDRVFLACGLEIDHFARLVPSSMLPPPLHPPCAVLCFVHVLTRC